MARCKQIVGLGQNLAVDSHTVFIQIPQSYPVFLQHLLSGHIEMALQVAIIKEPGKGFDIKGSCFKRNPKADIIAVEKIHVLTSPAFMIRIMVAVMSDDENEIIENLLSDGKVPVKLRSLLSVIVSDKLCKESCRRCKMNYVLEAKIPAVYGSGHIVETGKSTWRLEMSKKLSVNRDFIFQTQSVFFKLWSVDKDLLGKGMCEETQREENKKSS